MKRTVKSMKKGEWFTKKDLSDPTEMQVWIRGEYDREAKKYWCQCFGDISKEQLIKGDAIAYTEFTF